MRWVFYGFCTREELEQILKDAVEGGAVRSRRRQGEAERAAVEFLHGAREVELGHVVYVIEGPVYGESG